jgi:hypothetical protein
MKKKIGDLTIREIVGLCASIDCTDEDCPIYYFCSARLNCPINSEFRNTLNDEIEV